MSTSYYSTQGFCDDLPNKTKDSIEEIRFGEKLMKSYSLVSFENIKL